MDKSNSSEHDVLNFVLSAEEKILRPPTAIEYSFIIEEIVMRLKPRLKYMGFRVLTADDENEYDRLMAGRLEGDDKILRLKQLYVDSIRLDNTQSIFYMNQSGRLLMLHGTRAINSTYEPGHAGYFITPVEMRAAYLRLMNRELLAEHFEHFGLKVGRGIVNGLKLEVGDALRRMDQRRDALSRDFQYVSEVFTRLKQVAGH